MFRRLAVMVVVLAASAVIARGQAAAPQKPPADNRTHLPLLDGWRFHKGDVPDAIEGGGAAVALADTGAGWEPVTLPHTWNAQDGQDGGNDYFRGDCWYRRHITVDATMAGKSLYLRFEGINRKGEVFVNGKSLGKHAGGQAAICMDATEALKAGDNVVAVKVSNRVDQDMPPLQADFTFFGGIYRPAELLVLEPVHLSPMDFASSGVYITTPNVTAVAARVEVRVLVQNSRGEAQRVSIGAQIFDGGEEISRVNSQVTGIDAGRTQEMAITLIVPQPHLWDGRLDPHLYRVRTSVFQGNSVVDAVDQPLGIRTFTVDPVRGFILNGKPYDLHGVNRHQDRDGKGWAISNADHDQDMALIKEMGCTAIRLAHYQHSEYFYQLCDRAGIIVWAEIPVVDRLATGANSDAFTKNAQQQYTELIRQNFNHPSICFWSAGNEVDPPAPSRGGRAPAGPDVYGWFRTMNALGRKEDPSRLTASAWRERFFPPADVTDVIGLNEYLGWYTGGGPGGNSGWEGLETYIANHSDPSKGGVKGMWAVTEYGAGSSIYFHSEKPVRMDHTEEYEALLHENTWKVLKQHPEIWGKFVWNMFDFAVDGRAEGDHAGRNDKGLVTYDRKTKKDAFYFYKAVWSQDPTLAIASKRFAVRGLDHIPVKVYTNAAKATLTVNGTTLPEKSPDNGTILWENVALKPGPNEVIATATTADGKKLEDRCTWTYTPGAPVEIYEAQDQPMKDALKAGPPRAR